MEKMAPAIQNGSSTSNADTRPQRPAEKKWVEVRFFFSASRT